MEYDDNGQKARLNSSIEFMLREKFTNRLVGKKVKHDTRMLAVNRNKTWHPECDETYYYINQMGDVVKTKYSKGSPSFIACFDVGNVFTDRNTAEYVADKLKLTAEIRWYIDDYHLATGGAYVVGKKNYTIGVDIASKKIMVVPATEYVAQPYLPMFTSEKAAEEFIELFTPERLMMLFEDTVGYQGEVG